MTPLPERVTDPKAAVLWAVLHKLETIDESASSRIGFASSILYNAQFGTDKPVFDFELDQIREILGIPMPEKSKEITVRNSEAAPTELTMRDEL